MLKYLLFDLDNTLYSSRYGLEKNVSQRIKEYTAAFLGVTPDEAWQMRRSNMGQYGTCLEWLMEEKGFTDCEAYLAAVHPPDEADSLPPDGDLRSFLSGLSIPKAILTNSPREHADRILDKLGIGDLFTHIFDIRMCNYAGKPRPKVYYRALEVLGISAGEVLFIDDNPYYVEGFIALDGYAVLFDENDVHSDCPAPRIRELEELTRVIAELSNNRRTL